MPFIRLSDDSVDHPKFRHLSDGAFRLWHHAMAYCRRYQTDGLIPVATLRSFRPYSPKRMRELQTPHAPEAKPLWIPVDGFGVKVHDYLEWNLSREEEQTERTGAAARMRKFRARQPSADSYAVTPSVTSAVTSPFVPDMERKGSSSLERGDGGKPTLDDRAARLLERYGEWYRRYRHGAKTLIHNSLNFQRAQELCHTWDDARLEKMAAILLKTDEEWIVKTDRSFAVFHAKAAWCDDRLKQWEIEHGVTV